MTDACRLSLTNPLQAHTTQYTGEYTMRPITRNDQRLNVVAHVMFSNMWEYYITELPDENGIGWALVCGDVVEYGSIAQSDIDDYAISYTTQLDDLMPPIGWAWADDVLA